MSTYFSERDKATISATLASLETLADVTQRLAANEYESCTLYGELAEQIVEKLALLSEVLGLTLQPRD